MHFIISNSPYLIIAPPTIIFMASEVPS